MFMQWQRSDTLPEMRIMVNLDHLVAIVPSSGGLKTKIYLVNGEAWEITTPYMQAVNMVKEITAPPQPQPAPQPPGPILVQPEPMRR